MHEMACHTTWNFNQNILLGLPNSMKYPPIRISSLFSTLSMIQMPTANILVFNLNMIMSLCDVDQYKGIIVFAHIILKVKIIIARILNI